VISHLSSHALLQTINKAGLTHPNIVKYVKFKLLSLFVKTRLWRTPRLWESSYII